MINLGYRTTIVRTTALPPASYPLTTGFQKPKPRLFFKLFIYLFIKESLPETYCYLKNQIPAQQWSQQLVMS
jgi:hypothetical protein